MSTTPNNYEEVSLKVRLGTVEDFRVDEMFNDASDGFQLKTERKPKIGQCYWVRSIKTGEFMNRHYIINDDTDWPEFKTFLSLGMIYVPVNDAWLEESHDNSTKQPAA